jgi:hypothetical protein
MIETVFAFFALAWVPWALSAVLVIGAVVIWSHLRRRLQPVLAGLEAAFAIVEDAPTPAAFRDRFPSVNEALAANPIIGEALAELRPDLGPGAGSRQVARRHPPPRRRSQ